MVESKNGLRPYQVVERGGGWLLLQQLPLRGNHPCVFSSYETLIDEMTAAVINGMATQRCRDVNTVMSSSADSEIGITDES